MPDTVTKCRDSCALLPVFRSPLPHSTRVWSVIYHCSSSSPKCGLSNELLVLGRSAFFGPGQLHGSWAYQESSVESGLQ